MHKDGIDEAVTVVLAPHYSSFSVGSYDNQAQEEADKYGIKLTPLNIIITNQNFLINTDKINETLNQIPEEEHDETVLIVSAHSLPKGLIERMIHILKNCMKQLKFLNKTPILFM